MTPIDYSKWDSIDTEDEDAAIIQALPIRLSTHASRQRGNSEGSFAKTDSTTVGEQQTNVSQTVDMTATTTTTSTAPENKKSSPRTVSKTNKKASAKFTGTPPIKQPIVNQETITRLTRNYPPRPKLSLSMARLRRREFSRNWDSIVDDLCQHPAILWVPDKKLSIMENYFNLIIAWLSKGIGYTSYLVDAMEHAQWQYKSFTIFRSDLPLTQHPDDIPIDSYMTNCYATASLLSYLALPADPKVTSALIEWIMTSVNSRDQSSADLEATLKQVQKDLNNRPGDSIEVLYVEVRDSSITDMKENVMAEIGAAWRPMHFFTIVAEKKGVHILQSYGFPGTCYNLIHYLKSGLGRRWSWQTIQGWLYTFRGASTPTPSFTAQTARAWYLCFGIDPMKGLGATSCPTTSGRAYTPHVRIFRIPDVQMTNLSKTVWKLKELRKPQR